MDEEEVESEVEINILSDNTIIIKTDNIRCECLVHITDLIRDLLAPCFPK